MKHSSLSAADWSLLSVQTCMLKEVMQSCSHSSRELYFLHAVPTRAWVGMREVHKVIPAFSLKTKPLYLIHNPSAAVSHTVVWQTRVPRRVPLLVFDFPASGQMTWTWQISSYLSPRHQLRDVAVSGRAVHGCAGKSCHFGWCKQSLKWIPNLEELVLCFFSFLPCSKTDVTSVCKNTNWVMIF